VTTNIDRMPRAVKRPTKASLTLTRATVQRGSLAQLAAELGKDMSVVSRWRSAERKPDADMRVLLSQRGRRPRIPLAWWSIPADA
jgi:transcriptional regulator with XRE-family HTH domain